MSTAYHARYFAYDLTRQSADASVDRLSRSLFDATVDLNPHQIEAALFAFRSPLSKGVLLADEVGLGKTIEAGLVICQNWAEGKRKLLVICPASIRKQWSLELKDKFNLPNIILDARTYKEARKRGVLTPFKQDVVVITSMNFAAKMREDVRLVSWDTVVIDEAHKLRNCYRSSNRMGQAIRWALEGRRKVLLTATPLQNSLLELYGLSTLIDEHIFGDLASFRDNFVNDGGNIDALKSRLASFCRRTLRKHVLEYVKFTARRAITRPFTPTDDEQGLYEALSSFLQRPGTYSINLQFCSLVINYDLPWNPQRIEQRIGRCHRYGQKNDVVVINFLNERNAADQRVFQLLNEKFNLFDGVFGASDEVIGTLESGVDFEKRVLSIYQTCRTREQIQAAFNQLQAEMEHHIKAAMLKTRQQLLEHFDEDDRGQDDPDARCASVV